VDGHTWCFNPIPTAGTIADFSCQGPRRDGVLKPELTAPGFGVAAAKSANAVFEDSYVTPDGAHVVQPGTSFSTPHVTGAVALLLMQSRWATAGPSAIRDRLEQTARTDGFTGPTPNPTWGYGKLDVSAAMGSGATVTFLHPIKHSDVTTGVPDSIVIVASGGPVDSVVFDYSKDEGVHFDHRLGSIVAPADGVPAILVYTADDALKTYGARVRARAFAPLSGNSIAFSDSAYSVQPPIAFGVRAVTPTPSRGKALIRFELDHDGTASLRIFSVMGVLVRTLADRTAFTAGRHEIGWDGKSDRGQPAPTGIYFCSLESGGRVESHRIVLVR
jgi:hypothetical protein